MVLKEGIGRGTTRLTRTGSAGETYFYTHACKPTRAKLTLPNVSRH